MGVDLRASEVGPFPPLTPDESGGQNTHVLLRGSPRSADGGWETEIAHETSVVLLAFASHPSGDLVSALEFPFLYFYRFHSGCCASGILGFVLMLTTVKLKSSQSSAHYASWNFLSKVVTAGLSPLVFDITLNAPTLCCLLLGAVGEALMVYSDRTGA